MLAVLLVAAAAALIIWDYYVVAPWTRDGRIRVQVASIAPQVSGQITELRVVDNQYVKKGDVLYVIDRFDYQRALASAKSDLRTKAADLQVKKAQAERRQKLSDLATTAEQQQQYVGSAVQAQAAFDNSQQQVDQAEINLARTQVQSPVNGFVTNLLMRVGDYAREGTTNISVIDADSYWIDGYFEETKMARVCVGDRVEAQLMGYRRPIIGRIDTVTRGISVSDAAPSTQGLPSVDPVYTWVRLAQRVPVRVAITEVPPGVPLVSGMTATVTITDAEKRQGDAWWQQRWTELQGRFDDMLHRPEPAPNCIPALGHSKGETVTIQTPEPSEALAPSQIAPGLTPGLTQSPKPLR
ncbi:MAG: HlyD family secretion protein [Parafilimonas terrae]|nr:HlyD family secretion protein [Parafilimonas terrae]